MRKFLIIILVVVILLLIGVLYYCFNNLNLNKKELTQTEKNMEKVLENKKIAMIIAFRDFRDEEYFIPKQTWEAAGAEITTVSTSLGKAIGKLGGDTEVNLLLENLKPEEFDAVVFVGGPGAYNYIDNETCHKIARETIESGKILGAICIAPAILAKAGVLSSKKATVWHSIMDKSAVKILEENGADFQEGPVVVDGKIITGNGPNAAKEFANEIINLLR